MEQKGDKNIEELLSIRNQFKNPTSNQQLPHNKLKLYKRLKLLFIAIIFLILIGSGIYYFVILPKDSPIYISDKLAQYLKEDNSPKVYSLTSPSFRKFTSYSTLSLAVSRVSYFVQSPYQIMGQKYSIQNKIHLFDIVYQFNTKFGKEYLKVVLEKNQSWQIVNFTTSNNELYA